MIQDPSISTAARVEHAVMLEHLQTLYKNGEDYYHARNIVMAEHGPRIARECGKETAALALKVLCSYAEKDMPHGLQMRNTQHLLPTLSEELLTLQAAHGGKWVLPPRRRWARKMLKKYGQQLALACVFGPVYVATAAPLGAYCLFIFSKFDFWLAWRALKWAWIACVAFYPLSWLVFDGGATLVGTKPVNVNKHQTAEDRDASKAAAKAELARRQKNLDKARRAGVKAEEDRIAKDKKDAKELREWLRKQEYVNKYAVPRIGGPHPSDRA